MLQRLVHHPRRHASRLASSLFDKQSKSAPVPAKTPSNALLLTRHTDAQFLSAAEHHYVFSVLPRAVPALQASKPLDTPQMTHGLGFAVSNDQTSQGYMEKSRHEVANSMNANVSQSTSGRDATLLTVDEQMEAMRRILTLGNANGKMAKHWNMQRAIELFKRREGDTGSSEVQIAVLSVKIQHLTEHLAKHKKDLHSSRGLMLLKSKRDRLLRYLKRDDLARYHQTLEKLSL
ncbi:hypothetical protein RI367_003743 [Sorochytrium milnesiophthora]